MPSTWIRLSLLALGLMVLATPPAPLLAQSSTGLLDAVEAALRRADFQEARVFLLEWQASDLRQVPHAERERGLWLEARLQVDPQRAEPLYRRLVLEYPGGRWSDQALHHLALLAEGRGDQAARDRWLEALVRDYPGSPLREGARHRLDVPVSSGTLGSPSGSQVGPSVAATSPAPSATAEGRYTLQVAAFSDLSRARSLEASLRSSGAAVRVVRIPGSELYRVRIGYFSSRAAAQSEARLLTERGTLSGDAMVRDDAHQERTP